MRNTGDRYVDSGPGLAGRSLRRWRSTAGRRSRGWSAALAIGLALPAVGLMTSGPAEAGSPTCGAVVTTSIRLQSDLLNCPGSGLVIGAADITVDLNGHTIDGLGDAAPFGSAGIQNTGADDSSGGYDGVVVKNGIVRQFAQGVVLVGTTGDVLRGLRISGNQSEGVFVDGFAWGNSSGNELIGNRVAGNGGNAGIYLRGSDHNSIRGNTSTANRSPGILAFSAPDNSVVANVLTHNSGQGIFLYDLADGNRMALNIIRDNALAGVLIAGSNRNRVVANTIGRNAEGVDVTGGDRPLGSDENLLTLNVVVANAGDGIFVYGPSEYAGQQLPGASGTVVRGNATNDNGDDGIDVRSAATTITDNGADRNVDLGIDAVAGVTDGGGNHAAGNGNPLQCVNVACS